MLPRAEKKLQTRHTLLQSTLDLMDSGRGFGGLSLREVTRQAGVVPAAFYRHFEDMDQLGLALVQESTQSLLTAIRQVRHNELEVGGAIDASVRIFLDHVEANRQHFMFLAREQFGGSPLVRQAITNVYRQFASDLRADLADMSRLKHLDREDLAILSDLLIKTVFSSLPDVLDQLENPGSAAFDPQSALVHKLRFIMIGAKQWLGIRGGKDQQP